MSQIVGTVIGALILFFAYQAFFAKDIYYAVALSGNNAIKLAEFDNLKECEDYISTVYRPGADCGKNCKISYDSYGSIYKCED